MIKGNAAANLTAQTSTADYAAYWSDANTISGEPQLLVSRGGTGVGTLTGIVKGNGTADFTAVTSTAGYAAYWSDANTISGQAQLQVSRGGTGAATLTGMLNGNATSAVTGITATQYGVTYWSTTELIASTTAGTAGYLLQANTAAAPSWIQATDAPTASTIAKRTTSGNISFGTTDVNNLVVNSDVTGTGKITIDAIRLGAPTIAAPTAPNSQSFRVSSAIETVLDQLYTVLTIATTASYCGSVDATISGSTITGSNCVFKITARYQRAAGAASVTVSSAAVIVVDTAATIPNATASITGSGSTILVRVLTDTASAMYWIATVDVQHRYYG
jgi:hypothetical protein